MNNKAEVSLNNHEWGLFYHREITVLPHYSRTCLKKQQADEKERPSSLERVHPSLKGGGRLFQRGER